MICDLHVHTRFSVDSEAQMADYCEAALARGVDCVCFTDHIDLNRRDWGFGYYDGEGYFAELRRVKAQYGGKLRILSGFELGEPHVYPGELARYSALPYDFALGSVHFWKDDLFPSELRKHGVTLEECFSGYWCAMLDMVRFGGIDCVAHLDFPKRYYEDSIEDKELLAEIFTVMIQKGIALEINTSTLRKGMGQSMPDAGLLRLYRSLGGRRVTVGSDAHTVNDLAVGADYAKALIKDIGLEEVMFIGRAACPVG